jgi:hypothetical protein
MIHEVQSHFKGRRTMVAAGVCVLLGAVFGPNASAAEKLSDLVSRASELRESSQDWAKRIKDRAKLPKEARAGAQQRYDEARTAYEAWRLGLKTELAMRNVEPSESQKQRLQLASERVANFIGYAQGVLGRGGAAAPVTGIVAGVASDLVDTSLRVYEAYKTSKNEVRNELLKLVDELEWKRFDAI